jgi:RNA polymerase sigma factor (sigma-70 family)
MRQYIHPAVRQLCDQQVRFTPVEKRLEQLSRAERLITELVPDKLYPYQYVCYRVTNYRSDLYPGLKITGRELEHDLSLFIRDLASTVPAIPLDEVPEPVLAMDEVCKDLKVSTKTLSRWRDRGLVTRWVLANGKRKVGVRQSLLRRFLAQNQERVEKSGRFSQLTEEEKGLILRRAKRMARWAPERFTEICRRIARRLGRSVETIRYTLKKFDQANPGQAIFKNQTGPLDDQAKQTIYSSYRRGYSINALAERFRRTRTSVYRIINEIRAHRLLDQPLDCISHASFDEAGADAEILAPMPDLETYEAARTKARASVPKDVPPELAALYQVPLLNREQEAHLFRKFNFLKHKALKLKKRIDPSRARTQDLDRLEELMQQAQAMKDQLISANMRLVASIAKRHAGQAENFFELLSDGNLSLMKAVEKFDYSRGNKFSTYASWAIMKNFARSLPDEKHRRDRFLTGYEEMFESAADRRTDEQEALASANRATQQVNRLLDRLDERERRIIQLRAGLNAESGLTLEQVGRELGITKERVRQLEARTMNKLRHLAQEEHVEI